MTFWRIAVPRAFCPMLPGLVSPEVSKKTLGCECPVGLRLPS